MFALKMLLISMLAAMPDRQATAAKTLFREQMEPAMEAMRESMGWEFMDGCHAVMGLFRDKKAK